MSTSMSTSTTASETYPFRLFLTYHALIEQGRRDLDAVVEKFDAANRDVDLDQRLTFGQWRTQGQPRRGVRAVR